MIARRIVWSSLLAKYGRLFLEYVEENECRTESLRKLAIRLTDFLKESIRTRRQAAAFWKATPAVLGQCDDQATYALDMAPEAYAWLHLLDRYVRTWSALATLVRRRCLPIAVNGVNVLDVGTGPGPSVLAITDFYVALSRFAVHVAEPRLIQPCRLTSVELSQENNAFRSRFREVTLVDSAETYIIQDLMTHNPAKERAQRREAVLYETFYNPETGYEEPLNAPYLADFESQSLYRYRLITLSNFLTNFGVMRAAQEALRVMFLDLQPGAVVLVIGGLGAHYPFIYEQLDALATETGLSRKVVGVRVRTDGSDAAIIINTARTIATHVESLCPMTPEVPQEVRSALQVGEGEKWGGTSTIRAYRRNRHRVSRAA